MNRTVFQTLAEDFIDESQVLLGQKKNSAAYYLAGYSVECAIKACICKLTDQYDFPPTDKSAEPCYSHIYSKLLSAAKLTEEFDAARKTDADLRAAWNFVDQWRVDSRYLRKTGREAEELIQHITDPDHGVLQWFKARW